MSAAHATKTIRQRLEYRQVGALARHTEKKMGIVSS